MPLLTLISELLICTLSPDGLPDNQLENITAMFGRAGRRS